MKKEAKQMRCILDSEPAPSRLIHLAHISFCKAAMRAHINAEPTHTYTYSQAQM